MFTTERLDNVVRGIVTEGGTVARNIRIAPRRRATLVALGTALLLLAMVATATSRPPAPPMAATAATASSRRADHRDRDQPVLREDEEARKPADELGVELQSFAGEFDGDNEAQVQAIESLISAERTAS